MFVHVQVGHGCICMVGDRCCATAVFPLPSRSILPKSHNGGCLQTILTWSQFEKSRQTVIVDLQ